MNNFDHIYPLLDDFITQRMQTLGIPGMAVALTDRERLLRVSTYGQAEIAARQPVTPDTLFEIGSISKSFTCMALLQLQEEGRIDLHAPVTRYLPWFQVQSSHAPITVHHLMSHTAGLVIGVDFTPSSRFGVWALRNTVTGFPPGSHFHYSNVGYQALGYLLEDVLGQPYGACIRQRILEPLGMHNTEPVITHETRRRLAVGYEPWYDDRPNPPGSLLAPATWLECGAGDGSIAATPADLARYLHLLLNKGQERKVLSEASFRLMTQRIIETGPGAFYGYGLWTGEKDGYTFVGHTGGMVGYHSVILGDLDTGLGVVVFINGPGNPSDVAAFALKLLRSVAHKQELPIFPAHPEPTKIERAADYAGVYRRGDTTLTLVNEGEQVVLVHKGQRILLEKMPTATNVFYARHPDFALFPMRFLREDNQVVEMFHGPDWYVNERYRGPETFEYPSAWDAYTGHYRSHTPWLPGFRIVLRKGELVLIDAPGDEEKLFELDSGYFRIGEEAYSPERLRFDTLINGQAQRAILAGGEFYRTFTP